jgi:hypothetical protein
VSEGGHGGEEGNAQVSHVTVVHQIKGDKRETWGGWVYREGVVVREKRDGRRGREGEKERERERERERRREGGRERNNITGTQLSPYFNSPDMISIASSKNKFLSGSFSECNLRSTVQAFQIIILYSRY